MKKIIAAFDSLRFSKSTMEHAIYLAIQTKAHLVGIFLDDPTRHNYSVYNEVMTDSSTEVESRIHKLEKTDKKTRKEAAEIFESRCEKARLRYTVHHDDNIAIQDLVNESIFADLLIISVHESFRRSTEKVPTEFMRDLLKQMHCPILLVPDTFQPFEEVVALYDGSPSSVYAMKMFSYLFSELDELKTEIITLKKTGTPHAVPESENVKEWVKWHFSNIGYKVVYGDSRDELVKEIKKKHINSLIITGAYERSRLSMWLKSSMADKLMSGTFNPLFIAHC